MNDRMGTELIFWLNGHRHAMWFDCSVDSNLLDKHRHSLADRGVYGTLEKLCEAHYVDGVLVKGERP